MTSRLKWLMLCLLPLLPEILSASSNDSPVNLLYGDSDVETETRNMTCGPFGNVSPRFPAWRHDKNGGYAQSAACIHLFKAGNLGLKPVRLPKGTYTFSYYVKSDKPGSYGFIAVNSIASGWTQALKKRAAGIYTMTGDWTRRHQVFEATGQDWYSGYFGCTNDGRFDRFMINRGSTPLTWVPSPTDTLTISLPDETNYVYPLDSNLKAEIVLKRGKHAGKLRLTMQTFSGDQTFQRIIVPVYNQKGVSRSSLPLPTGHSGWFLVTAEHPATQRKSQCMIVIARPPEPTVAQCEPFVGLCDAQNMLAAAKLLGVKWLQEGLIWYEGKNSMMKIMEQIHQYKKQGFFIQLLINAAPPKSILPPEMQQEINRLNILHSRVLAPPDMQRKHFYPMACEALREAAQDIDIFELGGELDAKLGLNLYYKKRDSKNHAGPFVLGESYEGICDIMELIAQEILRLKPQARISCVRPSDVDARHRYVYSREVFKRLGRYTNCFGIDCYPQPRWIGPGRPETGSEQDLAVRLRDARQAMSGLVQGTDVMISEYGYFIDHTQLTSPRYAGEQVNRLARSYLKARLLGMKALHYYSASDSGLEGKRYLKGIWFQGQPLAAVAALNNVARIVENVTECREIMHEQGIAIGIFRKYDGRAVAAIWSKDSHHAPVVTIPADEHLEITDVMGNPITAIRNGDGQLRLKLSPHPYYIWRRCKGDDNYASLATDMECLDVPENMPPIIFRMARAGQLKAYVMNDSMRHPLHGKAICLIQGQKSQTRTFNIAPNTRGKVLLPLPPSTENMAVRFHFLRNGKSQVTTQNWCTPEIIRIRRIPRHSPASRGNWWKDIPPLMLSGRDHIAPIDHVPYTGDKDLSAQIHLAHDGENFLFAATVTDDIHFNKFTGNIFRGDSLQMAFDPEMNYLRETTGMDEDDILLSCGLQDTGTALSVHHPPQSDRLQQAIRYDVLRDSSRKTTFYQLTIPLKKIGANMRSRTIFGFNVLFMDDDSNGGADYWLFLREGIAGGRRPDKFAPCMLE